MVKDDDDPDSLISRFAIRANALDTWFPEFTADLVRNSFVSINASYTLANRNTTAPHGRPLHNTDSLRYLCACYCDIDYYRRGVSHLQVRAELERMYESGELPEPSMVVDSGKGMWLLWLLHDAEHPERAHLGAYADNANDHLQLYTRINKALHQRLDHIGADPISDGVRSIRVPGSFRNDVEKFVKWRIHGDSDRAISYTLKELAAKLGVVARTRPSAERKAIEATRGPRGNQRNGWVKTNQNRLAAIATILDQRAGGFRQGCRNKGAFIYALALKWNGTERREARTALIEMGAHCDPPLSVRECLGAVKAAYKTRMAKLCYQTMADQIDLTPEEAEIVSQVLYGDSRSGDRRFFPAARRFGQVEPITNSVGGNTRRTKQAIRRDAIAAIVDKRGRVPTVREMRKELREAGGIESSVGGLHSDYKAMGLTSHFTLGQKDAQQAPEVSTEHVQQLKDF
jgi:hypothetical protein